MPMYANTHTEARYRTARGAARSLGALTLPARRSATGAQTTMFREEARETIKRLLGCTEDVSARAARGWSRARLALTSAARRAGRAHLHGLGWVWLMRCVGVCGEGRDGSACRRHGRHSPDGERAESLTADAVADWCPRRRRLCSASTPRGRWPACLTATGACAREPRARCRCAPPDRRDVPDQGRARARYSSDLRRAVRAPCQRTHVARGPLRRGHHSVSCAAPRPLRAPLRPRAARTATATSTWVTWRRS
jgi:hypothetical protein